MADQNDADLGGAIVVFAKCPIAGASKTRLAPMLGEDGAALLARAMLSDILVSLSECVSTIHLLSGYCFNSTSVSHYDAVLIICYLW